MDNRKDPRLKIIREHWYEMQLTQQEAANILKISQPCFNQYLHGAINLNTDTVIKFATLFNVPPSSIDSKIY